MVDSTTSRKQLWNRSFIHGFLLVVTLVLVCVSHVNSFERNNENDINCSNSRTCTKCAEKTSCIWSLKRQTCVKMTQWPEAMTVNIRANCPQFSIVDSFNYKSHLLYTYKLKVSNDVSGFVKYLYSSNITCSVDGKLYNGTVDADADTIHCASVNSDHLEMNEQKMMIYHFSVMFDDVALRIDDGVNNYLTVYNGIYDSFYCRDIFRTKDCVSCFWDSEHSTSYYKRCSSSNTCTGLFEFYDHRNLNIDVMGTPDERMTSDNTDNTDDNITTPLSRFEPPAYACPDLRIQLVEPSSALWSGGTTLVITIRNHKVLADSHTVTVSVAGRDCFRLKTLNGDTVECTVGPPKLNDPTSGPVRVAYGSTLLLTSAQTFKFVYPEPTAVSPTCGPVTGGTLLRITGRSLDASSTVIVTVGPANVTCELVARYEDRILCVTGPSDGGPVAGPVSVVFDKSLRRTVGPANTNATAAAPSSEPVQFAYAGDPVLDAGQPFSGIASGGTYVPVRGRNFRCVGNATLYVDDLGGVRHDADCGVHNDTFMVCRSPALVDVLRPPAASVPLHFGFRLRFADHTIDLSPQPDHPNYHLYADPVFVDFEITGRNVTIYGRHGVNTGFRSSVDLVVRLRNAKGASCTITDCTRPQSIVCERPPAAAGVDENLFSKLYVAVGQEYVHFVKIKTNHVGDSWGLFHVFFLIASILACVLMVFIIWYCCLFSSQ